MTFNCNTETSKIVNAHLHQVQPRKKKNLICCPFITMLYSTTGHHKFWTDSVATSTQQFWPCTIRLSLIWSFEKNRLWRHHYTVDYALQHNKKKTSGCRGGSEKFTIWEYMLLFESGRRMLTKMETSFTNNYAFINVVVKYYENITCPFWKSQN